MQHKQQAMPPSWDAKSMDKFIKKFGSQFRENYINSYTPQVTYEDIEKQHASELMEKSDINSFVKEEANSMDKASKAKKAQRELRKKNMDAGPNWFGMKAPIMSDELLTEVKLIKLQHVLDPKYKYHKDDDVIPKHFEIGKYIDTPDDYYNRNTRKERNASMSDVMLKQARETKDKVLKGLMKGQTRKNALMRAIANKRRLQKQGGKGKFRK